jgi:sigma54-dependent transcription regulator
MLNFLWYLTPAILARLQRVRDAGYDGAPGCLKGTREKIVGKVIGWIDGHRDQPICWLNGSAGSGKSAIAREIASLCEQRRILGASFFFLRGATGRSSIAHFISTLAYRLAYAGSEEVEKRKRVSNRSRGHACSHKIF